MADAIPAAKAPHSLDCFNVPESSCANKQAVTVKREESLSLRVNPGGTTIPTCAFYHINPTQRHFAGLLKRTYKLLLIGFKSSTN